jgi:DNA (cytosine-5)-methyltransferase 1
MNLPGEPWLLDLFCGAGGASVGYRRAGFNVVGVDHEPQPNYPFEFCRADALEYLLNGGWKSFDAIHASPPCQRYSQGTKRWKGRAEKHPDLIGPVRDALESTGLPWIIENVVGAPLHRPITLCGTMFGLRVFRHRLFEASFLLLQPGHQKHNGTTGAHRGYSTASSGRNGFVCVAGHNFEPQAASQAMGIDWVQTRAELCQMIPPAFTEFVGRQLLNAIG